MYQVVKHERFDKSLPPELPPHNPVTVEKTKEKVPAGPVTVLSQTEQLLTAMRFSSKTAASLNNFIEGRNLKQKLEAKIMR